MQLNTEAPSDHQTPRTRSALTFALVLDAIALGVALLYGGTTLEDAFITFRYARNFADGARVGVWNVGQPPVEGMTSLLWMLILGIGIRTGISPFALSKIIGVASLLAMILLFGLLARRAAQRQDGPTFRAAIATAVLTALYVPIAWYSVSGMETTFFSLMVAWVVVSLVAAQTGTIWIVADCAVIVLLVLLRPEGVFIGLCLALWRIIHSVHRDWKRFIPLGALTAAAIAVVIYRLAHFGDPLPNTYYAKASGAMTHFLRHGRNYLHLFFANTWPVWLMVLLGGLVAWRERQWLKPEPMLAFILAVYFAYLLRVGGDPISAFPLWRHFVHIAPVWLFLAGSGISRLSRNGRQAIAISAAAGLLTAGVTYAKTLHPDGLETHPGFGATEPDNAYFAFINRFVDDKQLAAASLAGQWGWYVNIPIIDMGGLNDSHIAHFGQFQYGGSLDSKTDMQYVMDQHPTIIDGYMSGVQLRNSTCPTALRSGRQKMLHEMLTYPRFTDTYYFVSNAPYDVVDRALFISESLADRAKAVGAQLVQLSQTVLADPRCLG